ncbi:cytochrome b [Pelagibaculum spongiae]|uniref:Cytochrome b n=1 Tax=Pelagibaculum spongiae TaxID=2080658 RepID=A0A2V1GXS4_9GAMM|nr:cytochrome b [Pelagibaculum spongiae]PVZ71961.1 cytochrome b [Pelagibaculum spongiae]
MNWRNHAAGYGLLSRVLHWLIALFVFWMLYLGLTMHDLPLGLEKLKQINLHKALGVTVFALVLIRLIWKLSNPSVKAPPGQPKWQQRAAEAAHWSLYGFMLAMPISGWVMSTAAGYPVSYFGLAKFPLLFEKNKQLQDIGHVVHEFASWAFIAVLVAHVGAALYHHFVVKDEVLKRMLKD